MPKNTKNTMNAAPVDDDEERFDWGWVCTGVLFPVCLFVHIRDKMLEAAPGERWYLLSRGPCKSCPLRAHSITHACCCVIGHPWIVARNRGMLRESNQIPGSFCKDAATTFFCFPFTLAQEIREIQIKGYVGEEEVKVPTWRKTNRVLMPLKKREKRLLDEARGGSIDNCKKLLSEGARVNCQDATHNTPLINAAYSGKTDCCEYLIKMKADIHHRDRTGATALLKAVQMGHEKTMTKLWELGAEVKVKDSYGRSAMDYAAGATEDTLKGIMGIKEEKAVTVEDLIAASMAH